MESANNNMKSHAYNQGNDTTTRLGCKNLPTLPTNSVFDFVLKRQRSELASPHELLKPYVARKLPEIFRAKYYNMGSIDKIFASQWLDYKNVVYGTKCNKVCVCADSTKLWCKRDKCSLVNPECFEKKL